MQLRNKTVSIIGGSGFIGRALVKKLALSGAKINVLTRNAVRSKNLKTAGDVGQVTVMSGDALVDEDIINSIRFADYVVNLIGIFHPSGKQNFLNSQAELPQRLGQIAKKFDVKKSCMFPQLELIWNPKANTKKLKRRVRETCFVFRPVALSFAHQLFLVLAMVFLIDLQK